MGGKGLIYPGHDHAQFEIAAPEMESANVLPLRRPHPSQAASQDVFLRLVFSRVVAYSWIGAMTRLVRFDFEKITGVSPMEDHA